jgi:hypothetical protein
VREAQDARPCGLLRVKKADQSEGEDRACGNVNHGNILPPHAMRLRGVNMLSWKTSATIPPKGR